MSTSTRGAAVGSTIVLAGAVMIASLAWSSWSGQEPTVQPTPSPRPHRVYLELRINNDTPAHVEARRVRPPGGASRTLADHQVSKLWTWDEIVPARTPTVYEVRGTVDDPRRRGTLSCKIDVDGKHVVPERRVIFRPDGGRTSVTCIVTVS